MNMRTGFFTWKMDISPLPTTEPNEYR
jgi:hypothetical protein